MRDDDVEPMPSNQMELFYKRLPPYLIQNPNFAGLCQLLEQEIQNDHYSSIKKAIVDYILMDPEEKQRLKIAAIPTESPQRYIDSVQ